MNNYYQPSSFNPNTYPQARNPTYYYPTIANQYSGAQQQTIDNSPLSNIVWIQGEGAAKSYMCPNGSTIALWDSEAQTIYIKSTDMNGRPTMTVLDYVNRDAPVVQQAETAAPNYVTQEQLGELSESFAAQIAELTKKLNDFKSKVGNVKKENK